MARKQPKPYAMPFIITCRDSDELREVLGGCCAAHGHLQADHLLAVDAFTLDSTDYEVMPAQRFALVILGDKATAERGPKVETEALALFFDRWYQLMCNAVGEREVVTMMMERVAERMGIDPDQIEILDDDGEHRGAMN